MSVLRVVTLRGSHGSDEPLKAGDVPEQYRVLVPNNCHVIAVLEEVTVPHFGLRVVLEEKH